MNATPSSEWTHHHLEYFSNKFWNSQKKEKNEVERVGGWEGHVIGEKLFSHLGMVIDWCARQGHVILSEFDRARIWIINDWQKFWIGKMSDETDRFPLPPTSSDPSNHVDVSAFYTNKKKFITFSRKEEIGVRLFIYLLIHFLKISL